MDGENPTAGDSGASITDRLERFLSDSEPAAEGKPPVEVETDQAEVVPEGATEQEEEPQTVSTADVAKLLGVDESALDVDEDGTIKVKTKIDGKEGAAKFQELLKNYQLQGHAENKARQAAEAEKALTARRAEIEQQAQARMQQVEQLSSVAASELMREYQSIDWNALRVNDPGQYAALKADFQERNANLQNVFQHVQQQAAQREQETAKQRAEFIAQQAQKLPELIPEWKDQTTQARETGEIREWAAKNGFQPQEMDSFVLAHHVQVMRKAMLYDKQQAAKPAIENKVRAAPRLVKPGQVAETGQATTLRSLKTQIKASGGKRGIEEYLIASGKV